MSKFLFKINNRPFIFVAEAAFKYFIGAKLYIWRKIPKKPTAKEDNEEVEIDLFVPKLSDSKLKELAWSLDIQEGDGTRPDNAQ